MVYLPTFTINNQPNVGKYSTLLSGFLFNNQYIAALSHIFFQVYTVSELAEQSTPIASALSDSYGLVENLSFVDLDRNRGWSNEKILRLFRDV